MCYALIDKEIIAMIEIIHKICAVLKSSDFPVMFLLTLSAFKTEKFEEDQVPGDNFPKLGI